MPGAQIRRQPVGGGKGQHTARGGDFALPDDHGAVVKRRLGEENIADQLLGNLPVDGRAGFHIVIQSGFSGKNDQRPHLFPAHTLAGSNGLGNHIVHFRHGTHGPEEPPQPDGTQVVQHPPQLRLEEDDQRQQSDGQELIQNKAHGVQVQHIRQSGNGHNHHHSLGNPHGAGGTDQGQDPVNQICHQHNVQII